MKEIFKNRTTCTQKEYNRFLTVQIREFGVSEVIYKILGIVCFLFFLAISIRYKEYKLLVCIVPIFMFFLWANFKRPMDDIKKNKEIEEFSNIYYFYKTYFIIECDKEKSKVFYFNLYRVIETEKSFYLYVSRDKAFLLSKEGFINSTSNEFKKFIFKRTLLKFKKLKQ